MGASASLSGFLLLLEISWFHAVLGYTQIGSVWKLGEASMPPWLSIGSASCPALLATGTEESLRIIWLLNCSVFEGVQPHLGNVAPFHGISKAEWHVIQAMTGKTVGKRCLQRQVLEICV